jgi:hypothetical protein
MRASVHRPALLAVLLVAFALRAVKLGSQELRGDEAFGYFFAQQSAAGIISSTLALLEPHPVASYLVEKTWLNAAGHSEFALRFTSAWFGVLAVALLFRLGRELALGWQTSALAAALLALSPYAIWHSQDARMYAMSLALTTASTLLALRALRANRLSTWFGYVGVSWLALHTHYFAAFVIVAQNAFALLNALTSPAARRATVRWLACQTGLALLYLPWLAGAWPTLLGYQGNGSSPALGEMLWRSTSAFAAGEGLPPAQRIGVALLVALLLASGALRLALGPLPRRRSLALMTLYLVVPLVATWLSALGRPVFDERYLVAAIPPFHLLMASALRPRSALFARSHAQAWYAFVPVVALLLVVFAGVVPWLRSSPEATALSKDRGWRELASVLQRYAEAFPEQEVRVAQNYPDPTLWYYYRGPARHIVLPPRANDAAGAEQEVARAADAGVEWVILPRQPSPAWDVGDIASSALASRYALVAELPVSAWPVQIYARRPTTMPEVGVSYSNGLVLAGAAVQPVIVAPGGLIAVHVEWRQNGLTRQDEHKISLQLLSPSGALVAQADVPLARPATPQFVTSHGILMPEPMQPGSYQLNVVLYDPAREGAPRLLTSDGQDAVGLGSVQVR